MTRQPDEFRDFPPQIHPGFGPYPAIARWDRQHDDGDTIWAMVDAGWNQYNFKPIRFRGIDAPELRRLVTRDAGIAAREFLFGILPYDAPMRLYTAKDPDQYGRYVADVIYLDASGAMRCANVDLVRAGHAAIREDWGWPETVATCQALGIDIAGGFGVSA